MKTFAYYIGLKKLLLSKTQISLVCVYFDFGSTNPKDFSLEVYPTVSEERKRSSYCYSIKYIDEPYSRLYQHNDGDKDTQIGEVWLGSIDNIETALNLVVGEVRRLNASDSSFLESV